MDLYHIWCNLEPGVSDIDFSESVERYLGELQREDRIASFRVTRRKLGLGPRELGEFHILIEVRDLAQIDQAFREVSTRSAPIEGRKSWFEGFKAVSPHRLLVAEVASGIAGYASSTRFHPKPAYHTSVGTTVYLDSRYTGRGLGTRLYSALLELLGNERQVHRAYGGVALPNPASAALHERLGFRLVGTFKEVGYKFDRFWDVSWYERSLSD